MHEKTTPPPPILEIASSCNLNWWIELVGDSGGKSRDERRLGKRLDGEIETCAARPYTGVCVSRIHQSDHRVF
jgi:hypothetical protein